MSGFIGIAFGYYITRNPYGLNLNILVFAILGVVIGVIIGCIVGGFQAKFPSNVLIGVVAALLIVICFFSVAGGNDMNTSGGRKGILLFCLLISIDAAILSLVVGSLSNKLTKAFLN